MANIIMENNNFKDNASAIQHLYEAPEAIDYAQIAKELCIIKSGLDEKSSEYKMVETLEENSKKHNWDAICVTIMKFASSFSSATLANLVGKYLCKLLGL